jgi:hypothetical protein
MLAVWIPGSLVCLIGNVLALVTMASALHFRDTTPQSTDREEDNIQQLAGAGMVPAVIGLIPQMIFWILVWPQRQERASFDFAEVQQRSSPSPSAKQEDMAVHPEPLDPTKTSFGRGISSPSTTSLVPTSRRRSLLMSTSNALRPMTTKTRLVLQTSFGSADPKHIYSPTEISQQAMRSTDEFETWDTSRVDGAYSRPKQHRTRLEPIPGSRPASPATTLNGPFPTGDDEPFLPTPTTHVVETGSSKHLPRPSITSIRSRTPSLVTPASANGDQSRIHPLFRSESPGPRPVVSPETVITASPYAGQIYSPEYAMTSPRLLGSRDGSRCNSPRLASRAGSLRSLQTVPTASIDSPTEPLPDRDISQLARAFTPSRNNSDPASSSGG